MRSDYVGGALTKYNECERVIEEARAIDIAARKIGITRIPITCDNSDFDEEENKPVKKTALGDTIDVCSEIIKIGKALLAAGYNPVITTGEVEDGRRI